MATAILAFSCNKLPDEEPVTPQMADYLGTVTVRYQESDFDNENIEVNFAPDEDGKTASITLYKIRFVPQMPVTIDVTIPNVSLSTSGSVISLSCDNVIPLAMGGEYPRYTVKDLSGELKDGELSFSLLFGDYPTSFRGVKIQ